MTNELEKQFFDTFGIEQRQRKACVDKNVLCPTPKVDCDDCFYFQYVPEYPYISNRALLEMICIHNTYIEGNLYSLDYESLKKEILKDLINEQESRELKKDYISDDLKHQVRTLFEEGIE